MIHVSMFPHFQMSQDSPVPSWRRGCGRSFLAHRLIDLRPDSASVTSMAWENPQRQWKSSCHWIGLRENFDRKPWFLPSNIRLSGLNFPIIQFYDGKIHGKIHEMGICNWEHRKLKLGYFPVRDV